MNILFLNPFHGGSHAAVAEGYAAHSRHDVTLLTLSQAGGWRWRMRGAAVTLARMLHEGGRQAEAETRSGGDVVQDASVSQSSSLPVSQSQFDLLVATDMLDLAAFLGLTRDMLVGVPTALYFHENQLTYPLPPGRKLDLGFPWINYTSALAADALCFNSDFHRRAFLGALPDLAGRFHDHQELDLLPTLAAKARVLPPGIDLQRLDMPEVDKEKKRRGDTETGFDAPRFSSSPLRSSGSPVILWNSRWEYDKQPQAFFDALAALEARGVEFRLIVVGEHIDPDAPEFLAARERLRPRTLAWGYAPDLATYRRLLWQADIVVSTAVQEFFGIAVLEAMYCGCVPILPRRLSYPELLPPAQHAACLYDDEADLVDTLAAAISNLDALRAHPFRAVAAQYDWAQLAPRYDALFEQVAGARVSR